MTSNTNIRFEDWEAKQMKDPEFRAAVGELEPAYQAARLRMRKRLWAMGQEGRSRALEYDGDPIEDLHHILPEDLSAEEWQSIISGACDLKGRVLENEPALEECHKELEALRKKVANMKEWIAWRDKLLKEAFGQIGVEWHPILSLPAVGYRRFVHEYNRAREQVLELEAEVHTLSTMLDCQWEDKDMDRHLRHRVQRALRCFASALTSDDPKAYAEAWGWTPQMLHELVDDMYPPSVDLQEGREETASDAAKQRCICGEELDALGICKALPYYGK